MIKNNLHDGLFISFEGIDGAGKSTHIPYLKELLIKKFPSKNIIVTREPGGTELGENLRGLLLHSSMHLETEALLMFAARREHLNKIIEPALMRGDIVISDRFTDATFAYQCGGRGLSIEKLMQLESWVQTKTINNFSTILEPNLTFLFDLNSQVAQERRTKDRSPDKFEALDINFFERVRNEYLRRASNAPERFIIIDASRTMDEVRNNFSNIISDIQF